MLFLVVDQNMEIIKTEIYGLRLQSKKVIFVNSY